MRPSRDSSALREGLENQARCSKCWILKQVNAYLSNIYFKYLISHSELVQKYEFHANPFQEWQVISSWDYVYSNCEMLINLYNVNFIFRLCQNKPVTHDDILKLYLLDPRRQKLIKPLFSFHDTPDAYSNCTTHSYFFTCIYIYIICIIYARQKAKLQSISDNFSLLYLTLW